MRVTDFYLDARIQGKICGSHRKGLVARHTDKRVFFVFFEIHPARFFGSFSVFRCYRNYSASVEGALNAARIRALSVSSCFSNSSTLFSSLRS